MSLLTIGIVVVFFIISMTYYSYQLRLGHEIKDRKTTLDILSNTVAGPSWTVSNSYYPGTLENMIESFAKSPGVVFIRIIGMDGSTVEKSTFKEEIGRTFEGLPQFLRDVSIRDGLLNGERILEFSVKARNGNGLWMGVTDKEMRKEAQRLITVFGYTSLALFMMICVGVIFFARKYFIYPLYSLIAAFNQIKKGNFKIRLKRSEIEEINDVFASLEDTAQRVELSEERLAEDLKRIKEMDQLKSEFISVAAHQLRTPLSAVKWAIKMIMDGDLGAITEEQKNFLKQGYDSNERMITLVNDLLNVARIEEGKFGYEYKEEKIEDLVSSIISELKHTVEEKMIDLNLNIPTGGLPNIAMDQKKMRLALQNVIDNAVKYTPGKGKVTITLKNDKMKLEMIVEDTGIGIPKDQQSRMFSKFFRGQNAVKKQTEGTGLGLFISKNIINKHGGDISFVSEENKGTKVYISLPLKSNTSAN